MERAYSKTSRPEDRPNDERESLTFKEVGLVSVAKSGLGTESLKPEYSRAGEETRLADKREEVASAVEEEVTGVEEGSLSGTRRSRTEGKEELEEAVEVVAVAGVVEAVVLKVAEVLTSGVEEL